MLPHSFFWPLNGIIGFAFSPDQYWTATGPSLMEQYPLVDAGKVRPALFWTYSLTGDHGILTRPEPKTTEELL